jgi:hypothetical protein
MKTSKTSTQLNIEDALMFSAEDSPANHSALQENEKEQRTTATCGRRCLELSESVNPVGSWARTFAGLLVGRTDWFSKRVTLTWKLSGTPSNRLLFQLVPQAMHLTEGTEFGLLPTPTTQEPTSECEITETGRRKTKDGKSSHSLNLGRIAGMLLTPTTREEVMDMDKFKARMEKYDNGTTVPNLATQIHGMLPTPIAQEHDKINAPDTDSTGTRQDNRQGESGQLNQKSQRNDWENFPTVPPICGGDDGLPEELDGITFSKWRRESIKAYGNAIVPQVAHRIFQSISDYESSTQIHK